MKQNGNIKSNAFYNPDDARHPPPTNMMEAERDSEIEKFIRGPQVFFNFVFVCLMSYYSQVRVQVVHELQTSQIPFLYSFIFQ